MKDHSEYPEQDGKKAEWDARQLFVKELQDINESANRVKMSIELREGDITEICRNFTIYLSLLRWYYRNLRPLFTENEITAHDETLGLIVRDVSGMLQRVRASNIYPTELEMKMEGFQCVLHEMRWKKGLVVPVSLGKDETGIKGWDGVV